jgi:signal transduction histidine kinase/CheY-like chemotaxis protein
LTLLLPAWLLLAGLAQAAATEVRTAILEDASGSRQVSLPHTARSPDRDAPAQGRYLIDFPVSETEAGRPLGVFFPGLVAQARIELNGHLLRPLRGPDLPPPSSYERLLLVDLPGEFIRPGSNRLELDASTRGSMSVSPAVFGPIEAVAGLYHRQLALHLIAPLAIALIMATISTAILVLWLRRRSDTIYAYFGLGSLLWALHTVWSLMPGPLLPGVHNTVWWTSMYLLFASVLVVFCLRLAQKEWPRFELVLSVYVLAAPVMLYAAYALGRQAIASHVLRLGAIFAVLIAAGSVAHYAWRQRSVNGWLLIVTGVAAAALAVRDWLVALTAHDNNPVYLTPYAGLLFIVVIGWALIDRFVRALDSLAEMNVELERRVQAKSAELTQKIEEIEGAREAAEEADRAKSSFLAAASHDLRQPVHALGLYAAALSAESLTSPQRQTLEKMNASISALDSLFGALLDISRLDAAKIKPHRHGFPLQAMFDRLGSDYEAIANRHDLRLRVRPTRALAWTDPVLLERILRNLIDNALKYTGQGGVLVGARRRNEGWSIEVWDSGQGIEDAHRERIFEEFYQVGNPERDRGKGLGLGLAIVRRIALLLQHPLELRSRAGHGSVFRIWVPNALAVTDETDATVVRATDALAGKRVLVIEDDAAVLDATLSLLRSWGCDARGAASLQALVEGTEFHGRLDAIVADYRLPGAHTGVDVVRSVWAYQGRRVPSLIVSGDVVPQRVAEIEALGMGFCAKPVVAAKLRSWLAAVLPEPAMGQVQ